MAMVCWPFVFLAASIAGLWLPAIRFHGRDFNAAIALFATAVAIGIGTGVLAFVAVLTIALLGVAAHASTIARSSVARALLATAAGTVATAMALHLAPGFSNPALLRDVVLSPDSAPFSQTLNFDKGAAGFIVCAVYGRRARVAVDFKRAVGIGLAMSVVTAGLVMALGKLCKTARCLHELRS